MPKCTKHIPRTGRRVNTKGGKYYWLGLYDNSEDPRTFVPKKGTEKYFPMGASINIGTTEGKVFLASLGGIIAWSFYGMARDSSR